MADQRATAGGDPGAGKRAAGGRGLGGRGLGACPDGRGHRGAAEEQVVLIGAHGRPAGTAAKSRVHTTDTPLHLAFSVYLLDHEGRLLLTRRALSKKTWPGVWTNSFCGHPGPGEEIADAALRRAREELGVAEGGVASLRLVLPEFRYRAVDSSGIVENEVCPVFVARLAAGARLCPDPAEVDSLAWVEVPDALAAARAVPQAFSQWMVAQLAEPRLLSALSLGD